MKDWFSDLIVKGLLDILFEGGDCLSFLIVFTESFRSEIGFFMTGFGCTEHWADRGCSAGSSIWLIVIKSN